MAALPHFSPIQIQRRLSGHRPDRPEVRYTLADPLKLMRFRLLSLAFAALLALGCDSPNPVAPAPPAGGGNGQGGTSDTITVSISSDLGQLPSGSTTAATLTVSAKKQDGSAVADGTEVVVNTNLGNFGTDSAGKPIQLVKKTLAGGAATTPFYAGDATGVANILAQVGTSTGRVNLPIVAPSVAPVAEFLFETSGLAVLFEDASTGEPTAWQWDFGDGETSTRQNPGHTYPGEGTYTVSLTVTAAGGTATKRKFVTVEPGEALIADFGFTVSGLTVLFSDASLGDPESYSWDFGDGKTSTERDPRHRYAKAGTYTVTLTVANEFGSDTASQFVEPSLGTAPQANFDVETQNLLALFTDTSTGSPTSWSWDFGDNSTSTLQNPRHTYSAAGTYEVKLTATNAGGANTKAKFVTVAAGAAPTAAFEAQANGLKVVFLDQSTGNPTGWSWDFGDGSTSTAKNPTHTYAQPGSYTVFLTATNAAGSDQTAKVVQVASSTAPVASFCYSRNGKGVLFTDTSTGSPTSWSWNFGDCASQPASACRSTARNPGHTYSADGTYTVTLTATNAAGQGSKSIFLTVNDTTVDGLPICN